jgi:hypothetical protein
MRTARFIEAQQITATLPLGKTKEEQPVQRFFFDMVAADKRYFDYHGRYFRDADAAQQHAQILSLDSGSMEEWQGGQVEVRDAGGQKLFSIAIVEDAELKAAA